MHALIPNLWRGVFIWGFRTALVIFFLSDFFFPLHIHYLRIANIVPAAILIVILAIFAGSGKCALWRRIWRRIPALNQLIPDLNGIWVGSTHSNWPTIDRMYKAATTDGGLTNEELHKTPEIEDKIAIEIKASLFSVKIRAYLDSTDAESYSNQVMPRKDKHGRIRLVYIYKQETPDYELTDIPNHLGSAELVIESDNLDQAKGIYWTERNWKKGLNTAGRIQLNRVSTYKEKDKSLKDYATQ